MNEQIGAIVFGVLVGVGVALLSRRPMPRLDAFVSRLFGGK